MKNGINNFVIFPREILEARKLGQLSSTELHVYAYIRLSGNPYGMASVSLDDIRNDEFDGRVSVNYVNKIVLSLKRKRRIDFEKRSGRRGSFLVRIDEWMLPNGNVRYLDDAKTNLQVRPDTLPISGNLSEDDPSLPTPGQTLAEKKMALVKQLSTDHSGNIVRSYYNDNDNENYNINNRRLLRKEFEPKTADEYDCLTIAKYLDEEYMNFILKKLHELGIQSIKDAYTLTRNRWHKLENPKKFFNKVLQNKKKQRYGS